MKTAADFDDLLLSKQESNIDLFSILGPHINIDKYYAFQSFFFYQKILFVKILI